MKDTSLQGLLKCALGLAKALNWPENQIPRMATEGDYYDGSDDENQAIVLRDLFLVEQREITISLAGIIPRKEWRIERLHNFHGTLWEPPDWDVQIVEAHILSPMRAVTRLFSMSVDDVAEDFFMGLQWEEGYNNECDQEGVELMMTYECPPVEPSAE